jgi:hypothetical protein
VEAATGRAHGIEPTHVVIVLVRDQDRVDLPDLGPVDSQGLLQYARTDPAVDENRRSATAQEMGVSRGSAAEALTQHDLALNIPGSTRKRQLVTPQWYDPARALPIGHPADNE